LNPKDWMLRAICLICFGLWVRGLRESGLMESTFA
jgi:hypothetical protein